MTASPPAPPLPPPPPPPPGNIAEVGRVLLSSSMLGSAAGLKATTQHLALAIQHEERSKPITSDQQQQQGNNNNNNAQDNHESLQNNTTPLPPPSTDIKRKKRKKKRPGMLGNERDLLQHELRSELERFLELAEEQDLRSVLVRLQIDCARLRESGKQHVNPPTPSPRWLTPHDSGYESDSSFTTASTSVPDMMSTAATSQSTDRTSVGLRLLRGSAQARVLLETRLAISRAATFCQAFADPQEPGSLRRRSELLRAFRALTELSKT